MYDLDWLFFCIDILYICAEFCRVYLQNIIVTVTICRKNSRWMMDEHGSKIILIFSVVSWNHGPQEHFWDLNSINLIIAIPYRFLLIDTLCYSGKRRLKLHTRELKPKRSLIEVSVPILSDIIWCASWSGTERRLWFSDVSSVVLCRAGERCRVYRRRRKCLAPNCSRG